MFPPSKKTKINQLVKFDINSLATALCLLIVAICTVSHAQEIPPEPSTKVVVKQAVSAQKHMIVSAHPLASEAGLAILKQGGSAVDAAIAAQMVLNLVEPQSSGIGGGGFLLFYDAETKQITSFDGRETAPSSAKPSMFLNKKGEPIAFMKAVRSGKAIGTPGLLAMLELSHQRYGKLPWKHLFQTAITLAEKGFAVSPRLHESIRYAAKQSVSSEFKAQYFNQKGAPYPVGSILKNPALANTFKQIAQAGSKAFYGGELAKRMVQVTQKHGGNLQLKDLRDYKPKIRPTICKDYRKHKICSMGLPSSGGITLLQTLGMLSNFELETPYSVEETHLILEAEKRSFADRNHYLADRDFTKVPSDDDLLSTRYLKRRAAQISPEKASPTPAKYGRFDSHDNGTDQSFDAPSTTHISVVDAMGNAVSLTSSVEHSFGSGIMVDGFVLNNQLTDFSFLPETNGKPVANAVAPNKRPRSSMTPVIILKPNGKLHAVVGSPGGSSIIGYVRKTIIALLDWKMPLQTALNAPHFMHKNNHAEIESGNASLADALKSFGHEVVMRDYSSGVHAIITNEDGSLSGAADPRREGIALGN